MSITSEVQRLQGAHTALNTFTSNLLGTNIGDNLINTLPNKINSEVGSFRADLSTIEYIKVAIMKGASYEFREQGDERGINEILEECSAAWRSYYNMNKFIYYHQQLFAMFVCLKEEPMLRMTDSDLGSFIVDNLLGNGYRPFDVIGLMDYAAFKEIMRREHYGLFQDPPCIESTNEKYVLDGVIPFKYFLVIDSNGTWYDADFSSGSNWGSKTQQEMYNIIHEAPILTKIKFTYNDYEL